MVHDQHVHFTWLVFVILHLYALSRASHMYIQCGFIPRTVWRFSSNFLITLGVGNLALIRKKNSYMLLGVEVGYFGLLGMCLGE